MPSMVETAHAALARRIWQVGSLCRAIADALDARFNPVAVEGEIGSFSRAASGHCYFSLKDGQGQLRCVMFRRAASLTDFSPQDGDRVQALGRLDVYDARGDVQLIVESLSRAGQGTLFEQFERLKRELQAQGLFDALRKRPLPALPRGIGLVTSLGAAALHDVATALKRRVPHVPVMLAPAAVQGAGAAGELVAALEGLYTQALAGKLDVILLVRGGGSLEDLWPFNDERLARAIVRSPVPVVCGVGHETDFTIADFCADLRAPTPTAAAELVARERSAWLVDLQARQSQLTEVAGRRLDACQQRLDGAAAHLGRPSARLAAQRQLLERQAHRLHYAVRARASLERTRHERDQTAYRQLGRDALTVQGQRLERAGLRLSLLDPRLVLRRGYALLSNEHGAVVRSAAGIRVGQLLKATLADGQLDLTVAPPQLF